nr:9126_t:CDS:2 [Entrophospora candida]CAG8634737.1 15771_t:CDS:2 [Entrophospora candida]
MLTVNNTNSQIGSSVINNYAWIIKEFTKIEKLTPKPQYFHSPQWTCNISLFDDDGCSYIPLNWRLKFHPNGNSESTQNNISCYLEALFSNDAQATARVNVNFYIGFYIPYQQGESRILKLVKRRCERHEFLKAKPAWGWPNFCSKILLNKEVTVNAIANSDDSKILLPPELQKSGHVLDDDTLVVHVVIVTQTPVGIKDDLEPFSNLTLNSQPSSTTFAEIFNSQNFSDIKLMVDGQIVYAHQVILAQRSHYFKTLIKNDWMLEIKESKPIHIQEVKYEIFYNILYFIYSGKLLEVKDETDHAKITKLQKIYIDAEMRKTLEVDALHELIEIVISEMISLINMKTWDSLLIFSWEKDLLRLRKSIYRFAKRNWNEIRESELFKNILCEANVDIIEELIVSVKI